MVSLEKFYENVNIAPENDELTIILKPLYDDVVTRIPPEPQFQTKGMIMFGSRNYIVEKWNTFDHMFGNPPDMRPANREGNCKMVPTRDGELGTYIISIVTDFFDKKTDDYIKGLIIHEFSEMSYAWRQMKKEKPTYLKLGSENKDVMLERIFGSLFEVESAEYFEKEKKVNGEAIRLGFEKEITALESDNLS